MSVGIILLLCFFKRIIREMRSGGWLEGEEGRETVVGIENT